MRRWLKLGAAALGSAAVTATAAAALGRARWARATAGALGRLAAPDSTHARSAGTIYSPDQLLGLPDLVRRYLAFALTPGQPLIQRGRLVQKGEFRTRPGCAWRPFTAQEHVAVHPPGFVWDAAIHLLPLLSVRVRDSYLNGEGAIYGQLAALVPVVDLRGPAEMAAASLQRYLAEAVWLPTALLPIEGVTWTPVNESTARATLSDRGTTVWIEFHFGPQGEIIGTSTERYRAVDRQQLLTPWVGRFWEYERMCGMMVPRRGEVGWILPDGQVPYWRGCLVDAEYEFAPVTT